MGKVRIIKKNDKAYIRLPEEMLAHEELELFPLKEGYYLLSVPLEKTEGKGEEAEIKKQGSEEKKGLSEAEISTLRKLISITFEKRTPPYMAKVFSEQDKKTMEGLLEKGHVRVYKSSKYRNGVYNISDRTYDILRKDRPGPQEEAAKKPEQPADMFSILKSQGFAILKTKNEAYELSQRLKQEKKGIAYGVKGFDGKFYVVTKEYLEKTSKAIGDVLKEEMDPAAIAGKAKIGPDGCIAVLHLMSENGEILEKKKGVYAPI